MDSLQARKRIRQEETGRTPRTVVKKKKDDIDESDEDIQSEKDAEDPVGECDQENAIEERDRHTVIVQTMNDSLTPVRLEKTNFANLRSFETYIRTCKSMGRIYERNSLIDSTLKILIPSLLRRIPEKDLPSSTREE